MEYQASLQAVSEISTVSAPYQHVTASVESRLSRTLLLTLASSVDSFEDVLSYRCPLFDMSRDEVKQVFLRFAVCTATQRRRTCTRIHLANTFLPCLLYNVGASRQVSCVHPGKKGVKSDDPYIANRRVRIGHLITQLRVVLKVASNHKSRRLGRILVWPFEDLASNPHSRL